MKKLSHSDQLLLLNISSGGGNREEALKRLYADSILRASIRNIVYKSGGTDEDAKDIFQEALIILDRKIRKKECVVESSIKGLLCGMARHLCYNLNRKRMRAYINLKTLDEHQRNIDPTWQNIEKDDLKDQLDNVLDILSERERNVLKYWQLSYSMKEIKEMLNLPSEGMTRKIKFNALDKLRKGLSTSCLASLRSYMGKS